MKKLICLFFSSFLFCIISSAQTSVSEQFSTVAEAIVHRNYYFNYVKNKIDKLSDNSISLYYSYKVNFTKHDEFKAIGFDPFEAMRKKDYLRASLVSPLIVEGVVVKKKFHTNPNARMHSEYSIKVKKTLFDEKEFYLDTIKILSYEGFRNDGRYVSKSHSVKYLIGEKVILFVEPLEDNIWRDILTLRKHANYDDDEVDKYLTENYNARLANLSSYGLIIHKTSIKKRIVFDNYRRIDKKRKVLKFIRSITDINNRKDFFNIHRDD